MREFSRRVSILVQVWPQEALDCKRNKSGKGHEVEGGSQQEHACQETDSNIITERCRPHEHIVARPEEEPQVGGDERRREPRSCGAAMQQQEVYVVKTQHLENARCLASVREAEACPREQDDVARIAGDRVQEPKHKLLRKRERFIVRRSRQRTSQGSTRCLVFLPFFCGSCSRQDDCEGIGAGDDPETLQELGPLSRLSAFPRRSWSAGCAELVGSGFGRQRGSRGASRSGARGRS